jgi:RAD51-like protein 2
MRVCASRTSVNSKFVVTCSSSSSSPRERRENHHHHHHPRRTVSKFSAMQHHHHHLHGNNNNNSNYASWQSSYSLNALPLSPTVRAKLQFCGFNAVQDVLRHHSLPVQLVKSVPSLTLDEAQDVLKACKTGLDGFALSGAKSASELLKKERERIPLVTFCKGVDGILGGGVQTGEITEFCGAPGVGKTQIGMQLAVSVQLPSEFSGIEGECAYIDTEGSFTCDRCEDMAIGARGYLERRVQEMRCSGEERKVFQECLESTFSVEAILKRIHVFRCHEVTELLACLDYMPEFVKEHPKVKLVVVDSIAFHFRQDFDDMALRASILAKTTNNLMSLAKKYELAVVTINQATTKPGGRLAPALGESYAHAATTRVALSWGSEGNRIAYVAKSPRLANRKAMYAITRDGVRDPPAVNANKRKFT